MPRLPGDSLLAAGLGTEQTEELLRSALADWPIYRVDSDSMQGSDAMQNLVNTINQGEPCILLGTQMLTKGHHFPGVSLVASSTPMPCCSAPIFAARNVWRSY